MEGLETHYSVDKDRDNVTKLHIIICQKKQQRSENSFHCDKKHGLTNSDIDNKRLLVFYCTIDKLQPQILPFVCCVKGSCGPHLEVAN